MMIAVFGCNCLLLTITIIFLCNILWTVIAVIGQFGHCNQDLINLLLTGRATSNVMDGEVQLGDSGLTVKGVYQRSSIGYLSHLEAMRYCEVMYEERCIGCLHGISITVILMLCPACVATVLLHHLVLYPGLTPDVIVMQVGSYMKVPEHPIWVVGSSSHFSVLFSLDRYCNTNCLTSLSPWIRRDYKLIVCLGSSCEHETSAFFFV